MSSPIVCISCTWKDTEDGELLQDEPYISLVDSNQQQQLGGEERTRPASNPCQQRKWASHFSLNLLLGHQGLGAFPI